MLFFLKKITANESLRKYSSLSLKHLDNLSEKSFKYRTLKAQFFVFAQSNDRAYVRRITYSFNYFRFFLVRYPTRDSGYCPFMFARKNLPQELADCIS
jgi:hypothetical protein